VESIYNELQWLPRSPVNFAALLKESRLGGEELRQLAMHALDLNQLFKLAKVIAKLVSEGESTEPLAPFRLAVLSNGTIDFVLPALAATAPRYGFIVEVIQTPFDQVVQEALSATSDLNKAEPDAVLFSLDYRALPLKPCVGDSGSAESAADNVLAFLQSLRTGIRSASDAVCIFQTFAEPPETLFGSLDSALPGTLRHLIKVVNRKLGEFVLSSGDVLLDVANLAATVGLANWYDTKLWNIGKIPFSERFIPLYADHVMRTIAALRGKARKALILDLDNTVWGGVIGDDGIEGIKCAQGDAQGEAHLAVQQLALDLRARGILLAVCSKNTDEVARAPFQHHPEMLLRLGHIAAFYANWSDKATNIKAIAHELNLGLDAMVFLDDNPVERGLVRRLLPEVAVPELPEDPDSYARILAAAGYFEAIAFADEDLSRADFYRKNTLRATLQKQSLTVDEYLASLEMRIVFQPFDAAGRARILQLINKSNQFNLTTRRYTDPELREAENNPNVFTLQVRLSDIFGDNGMISVVICHSEGADSWNIDTWLMSCRVLGRKVENAVLDEILRHARAVGIQQLTGSYKPSGRNKLVSDHYPKLGFTLLSEQATESRWILPVADAVTGEHFMTVDSFGFESTEEVPVAW
jgi:FkbH-like protein